MSFGPYCDGSTTGRGAHWIDVRWRCSRCGFSVPPAEHPPMPPLTDAAEPRDNPPQSPAYTAARPVAAV